MFSWYRIKYRGILDSMTDGVYFIDLHQKIQYWNSAAEKLTGITAGEIVGKSIDEGHIRYEDGDNTLQPFAHPVPLCLQEKKVVSKTFFIKTKYNKKIPIEESAAPFYEKGKIAGVVVTFRDISHCIRAVEQRLKSERKERLIPICGWCKKIRSDEDYWEQLETYLTNEGSAFSLTACALHARRRSLRKRSISKVIRTFANQ